MKTINNVNSVNIPAYAVVNLDTNNVVELCASRDIARVVLKFHKQYLADTFKFKIIKLKADKYIR